MVNYSNPLISVIIPVYGVEKYLPKCVDSVLSQTYQNIEVILVDDCSPDNCPQLCDAYAAKDSRVRVIHKQNGGLVSARNAGFDAVTGAWHMYIDADDWIAIDTCEQLIEILKNYEDVNVVFWKCVQDFNGKSIKGKWEWPCPDDARLYESKECRELSRNVLVYKSGIATAYCKLIRTKYALKYGIRHNDGLCQGMEGTEFSLRCFYYANKSLYLNKYFYFYRYNSCSISKGVNEDNAHKITDCLKVILEDVNSWEEKEIFLKTLYQRVVYAVIAVSLSTYFNSNNPDGLLTKKRKFVAFLNEIPLYNESIKKSSIKGLDKSRIFVLYLIKMKLYVLISLVSFLKQYFLKKGYFNY